MADKTKASDKWIQDATSPGHEGDLHSALGVPRGEKIPAAKLNEALHSKNPHIRQMAQFAKNVRGLGR